MIKFSVIIPVHNAESYITDAINSVQQQTYQNYEIIVIDDKSTDNTFDVVKKLAELNKNIFLLKNIGRGVSDARNLGIEYAKGNYILFLDADDFYISDRLFESLAVCAKSTDSDIIYFGYSEGKLRKQDSKNNIAKIYDRSNIVNWEDILKRTLFMSVNEIKDMRIRAASPWAKTYKSEIIKGNDIRFPSGVKNSEDAIFNLRLLSLKPTISLIEQVGYYYWNNASNSTRRYMPEFKDDFDSIVSLFEKEAESFMNISGARDRMYIRLYFYVDKVLRQYFYHKEHNMDLTELSNFINKPMVQNIVKNCKIKLLPISFRLIVVGLRLKSPIIISLGMKQLPRLLNLLR